MARKVSTIQQQTIDALLAEGTTPTDITKSKVSRWLSWTHIVAVCIAFFEQILDIFTANIENRVNRAGIGSSPWLLDRIKEFQYGNAVVYDPTVGQWYYPTPSSPTIITRAGISDGANKVVNIKVAKSNPPIPLGDGTGGTDNEKGALQTYINKIGIAGVQYQVISLAADQIYLAGIVYFDGQYSNSIQTNVEQAINNLFATLSDDVNFGGTVSVNAIISAVLSVAGVKDFRLSEAAGRTDSGPFSGRSKFYDLSGNLNNLVYLPISGYVVAETTSGQTLSDKITYVVQ